MTVDLSYLEGIIHTTRSARFQAARRLRICQGYAVTSQLVASVALVFWSFVPVFYKELSNSKEFSLFSVIAAVLIFSIGVQQQAAKYIDRAVSLEASGRRIDALRRAIQGDIIRGLNGDGTTYIKRSQQYAKALEDNPVNHSSFDTTFEKMFGKSVDRILLGVASHALPFMLFLLIVVVVLVVPVYLTIFKGVANSKAVSQVACSGHMVSEMVSGTIYDCGVGCSNHSARAQ